MDEKGYSTLKAEGWYSCAKQAGVRVFQAFLKFLEHRADAGGMVESDGSGELRTPSRLAYVRAQLPRGGSLPVGDWDRRHRALVAFLWINALVLPLYGVLRGQYATIHTVEHTVPLLVLGWAASSSRFSRKLRSVFCSLGLLTAAALLVHLTGGLIEAHFYFFVVIVLLTLYEDWLPFLVAVGYVLFHHGVLGTLDPHEVYNRPEAWANPWGWAAVHAFFVALAGTAGIIAWRLNENVRERMRTTQLELAQLSETDSLTDLANRRKAMSDLDRLLDEPSGESVLVILDLNGFKSYNDLFGHPAGDSLLTRLGRQLTAALAEPARAYRLGGDEFCILGPGLGAERAALEATAAAALCDHGRAFSISASYGSVLIPTEAASPAEAMRLADQRMYARKQSSRTSAMSQSKDVLLRALAERHPELGEHVDEVARLAAPLAEAFEMSAADIAALRSAAALHDVGKVAIPDAILQKPAALSESEWEFIHRHTLIGERIVAAAPALAGVGEMIRSSHERWDGSGYPDQLAGEAIPLGARIIAVCDAYSAMISDRPYSAALSRADTLAELRRCAGGQFDPRVVERFEELFNAQGTLSDAASIPAAAEPVSAQAV